MQESFRKIHMIAICGTGMGSLAGLLKEKGYDVTGSDANVYPPMSDQLAALGIRIFQGYQSSNIDQAAPSLVIIGNVVSKTNDEVQAVLEGKLPYYSMPEAVEKLFLAGRFPIVIAGTHGKTTTCAIAAWLLERTGQSPGFLVGGILKNFQRSYQLGSGDYFVVEGDEYDSAFFDKGPKFLHYRPQVLILNAVEFDHADIYRDLDHVLQAFERLIVGMPKEGLIIADGDSKNVRKLLSFAPCRVLTFGLESQADLRTHNLKFESGTTFELIRNGKNEGVVNSPLIGHHNTKNLLGVLGALLDLGIPFNDLNRALGEFQGVKRRQEILGTFRGVTLMDDFAHHPTAVKETLSALRNRYGPKTKLWAVFEPRSNTTRRKVFQTDFVTAFDTADEVIMSPPYLAEKISPEERLDPDQLIRDLTAHGKKARLSSVDETVDILEKEAGDGDVVCFMSNGGFGGIYQKTISRLSS